MIFLLLNGDSRRYLPAPTMWIREECLTKPAFRRTYKSKHIRTWREEFEGEIRNLEFKDSGVEDQYSRLQALKGVVSVLSNF
jgi:hypothetical protein